VRTALRRKERRERKKRPSKLDPFKPLIKKLVITDELTAVRVLEEIRAIGYVGGDSIVKACVRALRPEAIRKPHLRFETEPGVQGQVDLSPYTVLLSGTPTPVVCFSLVLGYSRWQYIRFLLHADVHSVCHCHVLAFEEMGGVPCEILYDRMKQVVLESYKDSVLFHPLFERMATHYGYRAVPLAPGYPEGKGKVENPFRYVEGNFLLGRTFHDFEDLQGQAVRWLDHTARVRIHRTTHEQPAARLVMEQPKLIPLPQQRFEAGVVVTRLIGDDFCVAYETNRYSVPPRYAGHSVKVRVLEGRLEVELARQDREDRERSKPLGAREVIASHPVRETKYQRFMAPEHEAEFRATCTSRHVLREQFQRLGPVAETFAKGLVELRGGAAGYHMSQILKLADKVGVARVAGALRHAARYGAFDHNAVARIVAGKPTDAEPGTLETKAEGPTQLSQYLAGSGEHQRSPDGYQKLLQPPQPTHDDTKEDEADGQ
jgi:transposase